METTQQENMLVKLIDESGLEKSKADALKEKFADMYNVAMDWKIKAETLKVTDITQEAEMKMADEGRKFLKKKRIDIENTRKELKEESLREGRAIDALAKALTALIEPIEDDLEKKAKFKEIYIANLKEQKRLQRLEMLRPLEIYSENGYDFANMDEATWEAFYGSMKSSYEKKKEEERLAEEQRLENERIQQLHVARKNSIIDLWHFFPAEHKEENLGQIMEERWHSIVDSTKKAKTDHEAEQERIRIENEQLRLEINRTSALNTLYFPGCDVLDRELIKKGSDEEFAKYYSSLQSAYNSYKLKLQEEKEREEKERLAEQAKIEAIRKQQEEELEAQRKENERLVAEQKARKEKEESDLKAEQERLRKEANAPEKDKALAYIKSIASLPVPEMKGTEAIALMSELVSKRDGFAKWANELINTNL